MSITRRYRTQARAFALLCGLASSAWAASSPATDAAAASTPSSAAYVEWLIPPLPPAKPQSEVEKDSGRQRGRAPPTPELLQPTLDPALPSYRPTQADRLNGDLRGASSDVLVGLVDLWSRRFAALNPRASLSVSPPYAGSLGAKELIKEAADFVFVSRELKPEDISEFEARFGYPPTSIPISAGSYRHYGFLDSIAFFVHPDNPLEQLTFAQIDAIFSSTRHRGGTPIRTWGQLGLTGDWTNEPIRVHGVKPWNGFEEFIRQRVLSIGDMRGDWRTDMNFEKVVFPLAQNVAKDRYALGYSGLAYLDAPVKVLPLASDAAVPATAPTYDNVASGRYPLSRLIYFNFNRAPGQPIDPVLLEFLRFVLSREGQQVVLEHGIFLPLRADQVMRSRAMIDPQDTTARSP